MPEAGYVVEAFSVDKDDSEKEKQSIQHEENFHSMVLWCFFTGMRFPNLVLIFTTSISHDRNTISWINPCSVFMTFLNCLQAFFLTPPVPPPFLKICGMLRLWRSLLFLFPQGLPSGLPRKPCLHIHFQLCFPVLLLEQSYLCLHFQESLYLILERCTCLGHSTWTLETAISGPFPSVSLLYTGE